MVSDVNKNQTLYFCDKDFDLRVWLPFNGENTISVYAAKITTRTYTDEEGIVCEGDYYSYSCRKVYEIKATNSHLLNTAVTDSSDKRFIYPSGFCQADNYLVQNWTNEALFGLSATAGTKEKFKAIHDYIVLSLYYDKKSVDDYKEQRKKQDAFSVIKNKTAVCEGYSNLTTAMARYAGIPARIVVSNKKNHAWNHICIDGKWLFCDTTWDDDEEPESNIIYYNYFLLSDYNGVNNDHKASDQTIDNSRSAVPEYISCEELSEIYKQGFLF